MIGLQKGPKYWVEKNAMRFVYPPDLQQRDDGYLRITFSGLNPNLVLYISEKGNANALLYLSAGSPDISSEKEIMDLVYDDIISIHMDTDGRFYCNLCPEPEYYSTPDELWVRHTLDDIIEWVNSFRQNECYLFFVTEGAVGADRIKKSDAKNKEWYACVPIVMDNYNLNQ